MSFDDDELDPLEDETAEMPELDEEELSPLDEDIAELYEEETSIDKPGLWQAAGMLDLAPDEAEGDFIEDEENVDWYALPDRGFQKTRDLDDEAPIGAQTRVHRPGTYANNSPLPP